MVVKCNWLVVARIENGYVTNVMKKEREEEKREYWKEIFKAI